METKPRFRTSIGRLKDGLAVVLGMYAPSVSAASVSPPVSLQAAEQVETNSAEILLGQIVTIETASEAMQSRLAAIRIGRAAAAGQARNISRDYILLRLRQSGIDPQGFDLRLPAKIAVRRSAIRITREEMEMMVRDHFLAASPSDEAQVNIKAVRIKDDILLPRGSISHEIVRSHQSAPSRMLPVAIVFKVDGRRERKVPVLVNLEVLQPVVVTRRPIPRLKIITPEDVTLRQVNVVGRGERLIRSVEEVVGKRARRAISMHAELHPGLVEWPPVVSKGDRVTIVAESGHLRITTMGEIKTTGKVGQQVRVLNLDSQKIVMAQVVDSHTVRVSF